MKQRLLKVMIALFAIALPCLSHAQSQEAAGTYNGTLSVGLGGIPAGNSEEDIYLIAEDDTHIRLEIRNFKFSVGSSTLELGDIIIPNVETSKEGNTITLLPKEDAKVTLPDPIGEVSVDLKESTIVDKKIALSLAVETSYPVPLTVDVTFDGVQTTGSGLQGISTEKPVIYYLAEADALVVKGAEHQPYAIFNITGMQIRSGRVNTEEIPVSDLSKGIYLVRVGNSTVKFVKK